MSCFSFGLSQSPVSRDPYEFSDEFSAACSRLMADECVREEQAAEADFIERRAARFNVEAA